MNLQDIKNTTRQVQTNSEIIINKITIIENKNICETIVKTNIGRKTEIKQINEKLYYHITQKTYAEAVNQMSKPEKSKQEIN